MEKREIKIINFLYLTEEEYAKILEYRNQEYLRKSCIDETIITKEQHMNYLELLKKKDNYFAFLIIKNEQDYGVVTFKRTGENIFYVGDYLIKEEYKFEGGGVVNRFCIMYICNTLNIKYIEYNIKYSNTRTYRAGTIAKVLDYRENYEFFSERAEVLNFYDNDIINSKPRKLFDKLYEIRDCQI